MALPTACSVGCQVRFWASPKQQRLAIAAAGAHAGPVPTTAAAPASQLMRAHSTSGSTVGAAELLPLLPLPEEAAAPEAPSMRE